MGDFNGHLQALDGFQDFNGDLVDFTARELNLEIAKLRSDCEGSGCDSFVAVPNTWTTGNGVMGGCAGKTGSVVASVTVEVFDAGGLVAVLVPMLSVGSTVVVVRSVDLTDVIDSSVGWSDVAGSSVGSTDVVGR
ncbi:hypothetical protein MRX96_026027 [Rhipicephalus microplus]